MNIVYERETKTEVTTLTDLVVFCENQLGWLPDYYSATPVWRQRQIEVGKLKRVMTKHRVTLAQLITAAHWCDRVNQTVQGPTYLLGMIERAEREVGFAGASPTALATAVEDAVSVELNRLDLLSDEWIDRLLRAQGPFRAQVLERWHQERAA